MDEVVRQFVAGEPDAVRAIYRRHGGAVFAVARSIVGPDLAADVVQQTFVKAWKAAETFDSERDLAPWLYAIARRAAIDALRKERRPTQGGHAPEIDAAVTPLSFERTWEVHEVRCAIDELADDERTIVRMLYLDGKSQQEVADALDLPLGTVKSRSFRAQKRLANTLSHLRPSENHGADPSRTDSETP